MNAAFALLLPFMQGHTCKEDSDVVQSNVDLKDPARCLLVADENLSDVDFSGIHKATEIISNRFDIAKAATTAGLSAHFNDFDFSIYPPAYFSRICYRISKEKDVVEHIINQSLRLLSPGGELILSGAKKEGLKRYAKIAATNFSSTANIHKQGLVYTAHIINTDLSPDPTPQTCSLQESNSNYTRLIPVALDSTTTLYSKAGAFGAARVDQGSAMLVAYLDTFFESFEKNPTSLLDLGCGYGYLAICGTRPGMTRVVGTDNCAAAVDTCRANFERLFEHRDISAQVIAADCAASITETFDAIICNPPFHQGFRTDPRLGEKFATASARLLKPGGKALFVVNQFVPLEKIADRLFKNVSVVAKDQGFKLIAMAGPTRSGTRRGQLHH